MMRIRCDGSTRRVRVGLLAVGCAALALAALVACGGGAAGRGGATTGGGAWKKKPVLYPNAKYQEVGEEGAQFDITSCLHQAETGVGNDSTAGTVAKNTGGGAAVGAALGAIGGAILGQPGTGAAAGAAVGGAGGLARGTMKSRENDSVFQEYAERCLGDLGYDVIGWR